MPRDQHPPGNWAEAQEPSQRGKMETTPVHTHSPPLIPGQDQTCHGTEINFHPLNKPYGSLFSIGRMTLELTIYVAPEDC